MPVDTSTKLWAEANADPEGRIAARLAALPEGHHAGTVAHPFPVADLAEYRTAIKGSGVFARAEKVKPTRVPIDRLVSLQHTVNLERLQQHLDDPHLVPPGTRAPGHGGKIDFPVVVRTGGVMYLHDGNHRSLAAKLRGDTTINARVVDLDQDKT